MTDPIVRQLCTSGMHLAGWVSLESFRLSSRALKDCSEFKMSSVEGWCALEFFIFHVCLFFGKWMYKSSTETQRLLYYWRSEGFHQENKIFMSVRTCERKFHGTQFKKKRVTRKIQAKLFAQKQSESRCFSSFKSGEDPHPTALI